MNGHKKIKQAICEILDVSDKSYYNWKNANKPIIVFLENYFDSEELDEFLKTGKITKLEYLLKADDISFNDFKIISIILDKIEMYTKTHSINKEAFLIKFYRTLRDMPDNPDLNLVSYFNSYDMITFESLQNMILGSNLKDVISFYSSCLSLHEIETLRKQKLYVLPPLKSMRKHNAHLKD